MVQLKRVYEEAEEADGRRILVDRVWPRGVSKDRAQLNEWMKSVAPSSELRKWFGHKPERFEGFKSSYKQELADDEQSQKDLATLQEWAEEGPVTLVYAAKDEHYNQAVILKELIENGGA